MAAGRGGGRGRGKGGSGELKAGASVKLSAEQASALEKLGKKQSKKDKRKQDRKTERTVVKHLRKHGVEADVAWEDLVGRFRAHLGHLKLAYRMYVLLEKPATIPNNAKPTAQDGAMAHVTSEMPVASLTQPVSHTIRGMRARVPVDRPVTTTARTVSFTIR